MEKDTKSLLDKLTEELNENKELSREAKQVENIANAAKELRGTISPETVFKAMVQAVFGQMNWN